MSAETRTWWFNSQLQAPARVGVYEVRLPWETHGTLPQEYAHWNGRTWGIWSREIHLAAPAPEESNILQRVHWRGLRQDPSQYRDILVKITRSPLGSGLEGLSREQLDEILSRYAEKHSHGRRHKG